MSPSALTLYSDIAEQPQCPSTLRMSEECPVCRTPALASVLSASPESCSRRKAEDPPDEVTSAQRWPPTAFPRVLLVLVVLFQAISAQIMDYLYDSWRKYETECQQNMSMEPPPTGLVCNRTFDKFSCWPDAQPNTTVNVSCPWFLPWHKKVQHGYVYKHCGPDGQWAATVHGHPLRDARECELDPTDVEDQERIAKAYESFKIMYTVGYSMSVGALVLALAILVGFSKLHCMRNYIHINLFISFILRGLSVLVIDTMLKTRYSEKIEEEYLHVWLSNAAGCRAASVLMQYGVITNYCWLLVEGIYLHNLLVLAVFSERSYFALYICIGWGIILQAKERQRLSCSIQPERGCLINLYPLHMLGTPNYRHKREGRSRNKYKDIVKCFRSWHCIHFGNKSYTYGPTHRTSFSCDQKITFPLIQCSHYIQMDPVFVQ
ncbi:glucagon receptor isoform X5 [Hyla sarda]|uniref:glucagon receptor isoform X5 n=1 Tax=Hyla sarda TaxID=327740 RepID=UPI0024C232C0|nr:glucagon receptor isoform X5 [Hyla sarda]